MKFSLFNSYVFPPVVLISELQKVAWEEFRRKNLMDHPDKVEASVFSALEPGQNMYGNTLKQITELMAHSDSFDDTGDYVKTEDSKVWLCFDIILMKRVLHTDVYELVNMITVISFSIESFKLVPVPSYLLDM